MIINLFGGPCSGKSTVAAEVYAKLKRAKYNAGLVLEAAQDFVYDRL